MRIYKEPNYIIYWEIPKSNCNGKMLVYNVLLIHCKRGLISPEVGEISPLNTARGTSLA